jgi:hypothetical protein
MAINNNFTDKSEWENGKEYGIKIINDEYAKTRPATKQDAYRITFEFIQNNKKNIKEFSDSFVAGMDTTIQLEFQKRWDELPAAKPTISSVAGMPGLVQVTYPAGTAPRQIKKTPVKKLKPIEHIKNTEPPLDPNDLEF